MKAIRSSIIKSVYQRPLLRSDDERSAARVYCGSGFKENKSNPASEPCSPAYFSANGGTTTADALLQPFVGLVACNPFQRLAFTLKAGDIVGFITRPYARSDLPIVVRRLADFEDKPFSGINRIRSVSL